LSELSAQKPADAPPPLRILLVEDDGLIRANTAELIERLGHSVVGAGDGHSAIIALQTAAFDVLLVDVGLGDMSGVIVANKAKEMQPGIGVVYATGASRLDELGTDTILKKPYDSTALAAVLKTFVTR
jgi:CheY-like chemotaxis protein